MTDREWIQQSVEKNADMLTKVSDAIWEYAELPFQETRSAALLMQRLQERVQVEAVVIALFSL